MESYFSNYADWWNGVITLNSSQGSGVIKLGNENGVSSLGEYIITPASAPALPSITRVRVFNENTVKVEFADKTFTTATTHGDDKFDLETGILICIAKRAFWDKKTGKTTIFSNVHKAVSIYKKGVKAEELKKKAEKEANEIRERKIAKAKAKRARRAKKVTYEDT